jgi:hypothetical protein
MPTTYASVDDVAAYLVITDPTLALPEDAGEAEAVVNEAEDDLDRLLAFGLGRDPVTGRKLDPEELTQEQAAALGLATCAQVCFLLALGSELIGDDTTTRAGEVSFGPTPRPPAPRAVEFLAGHGLPWRSGTVAPAPEAATE